MQHNAGNRSAAQCLKHNYRQVHAAKLLQHNSNLSSVSLVAKPISHTSLGSTFTVFPKQVYFIDDFPILCPALCTGCQCVCSSSQLHCPIVMLCTFTHSNLFVICSSKKNKRKKGSENNSMYYKFEQISKTIKVFLVF